MLIDLTDRRQISDGQIFAIHKSSSLKSLRYYTCTPKIDIRWPESSKGHFSNNSNSKLKMFLLKCVGITNKADPPCFQIFALQKHCTSLVKIS